MKPVKFVLSSKEYSTYQEKREKPRGAFAEIWEPDNHKVSLHIHRVETQAIRRVEGSEKRIRVEGNLFLKPTV